jgi:hypothetical protein
VSGAGARCCKPSLAITHLELEMPGYLLQTLRPYGARDFIDVQSFIWMVGGSWEN